MTSNSSGDNKNPYLIWEERKIGLSVAFIVELNELTVLVNNLKFSDALERINRIETQYQDVSESLFLQAFKLHVLRDLGMYDSVKKLADEFLVRCDEFQHIILAYQACVTAGISEYYRGDKSASRLFLEKGNYYFDRIIFLDPIQKTTQELWIELQNSWIFFLEGNFEEQFENTYHVFMRAKELGIKDLEAWSLVSLDKYYNALGDINTLLETAKKGLDIAVYINNLMLISIFKKDLGLGLRLIGKFDEALSYQEEYIDIWLQSNSNSKTALQFGLGDIALTYHLTGNYQLSYENYLNSLEMSKEINNYNYTAELYARIIQLLSDWQKASEINNYLDNLEKIYEQYPNINTRTAYFIGKGLFHKTSTRIKDKSEAINCFNEIITNTKSFDEFRTLALFNVLELFLEELELTGSIDAMLESKQVANKLLEIAKRQHNSLFQAELDFLSAKIAVLDFDFNGARTLMAHAEKLAKRSGYGRLAIKISREHDRIISAIDNKEHALTSEAPLQERAHFVGIKDYYSAIAKKIYVSGIKEPKNEQSVAIMISTMGGLVIYFHPFNFDLKISEHLVGGFLSAISAFGKIIFNKEDQIDRIFFKENTLLLSYIDKILFCYAIKGESYRARKRLNEFIVSLRSNKDMWGLIREEEPQTHKPKITLELDKIANEIFYMPISDPNYSMPMIDDLLVNN